MYKNLLFIGVCAVSGGFIYNAVGDLFSKQDKQDRQGIVNYGMLMGLTLGSGIYYLEHSQKSVKLSE